jgi:hypothetical protein
VEDEMLTEHTIEKGMTVWPKDKKHHKQIFLQEFGPDGIYSERLGQQRCGERIIFSIQ